LGVNLETAHVFSAEIVINAINAAPLNRGLKGDDWVSDSRNVAIVEGEDIVLFDYESPGVFQIHVLLSSRGRGARECIKRALYRVFRDHAAELVFGMVPDFRRDVKMMARMVGMKSQGKRITREGICELFVLRRKKQS
jgi:hypothetical protein